MAINIIIPDTVIKKLNKLPKEVRIKFWEQIERLTTNPSYPSLRNEKLNGVDQWAFSITMNYRTTYIKVVKKVTLEDLYKLIDERTKKIIDVLNEMIREYNSRHLNQKINSSETNIQPAQLNQKIDTSSPA